MVSDYLAYGGYCAIYIKSPLLGFIFFPVEVVFEDEADALLGVGLSK